MPEIFVQITISVQSMHFIFHRGCNIMYGPGVTVSQRSKTYAIVILGWKLNSPRPCSQLHGLGTWLRRLLSNHRQTQCTNYILNWILHTKTSFQWPIIHPKYVYVAIENPTKLWCNSIYERSSVAKSCLR